MIKVNFGKFLSVYSIFLMRFLTYLTSKKIISIMYSIHWHLLYMRNSRKKYSAKRIFKST